ncbi:MAG: hypothetical protein WBC44_12480 [Planctomycetaceae bacterium]
MTRQTLLMTLLFVAGVIGVAIDGVRAQSKRVDAEVSREKAALTFASRHHPELAELLKRLKASDAKAFEKAVRDVSQSRERLSRLEANDPERYEHALRVWTLDSRIRLLAARSAMSDDPSIEERLRELLQERRQARLSMLRLEHRRLESRVDRIEGQIDQLERNGDDAVENDLARIKRAVTTNRARKRPTDRPRQEAESGKTENGKRESGKSSTDSKASSKDDRKATTDRKDDEKPARSRTKDRNKPERKSTPLKAGQKTSPDHETSTSAD